MTDSTTVRAINAVRVDLLGPLECTIDGSIRPIPGAKPRAILATLAMTRDRVVPFGAIIEALWGDDPPNGVEHTLQQHVSTLRKALRRADGDASPPLVTQAPAYRLTTASVDVDEFESLAAEGRAAATAE